MFTSNISLVTLVRGVGGKLSRLVYLAPRLGFGSNSVISSFLLHHNFWLFSCKRCEHYFSQTEMFTSNISLVTLVRGVGGKLSRLVYLAPRQGFGSNSEIKFISLITKYFWSRWCNKICWLSILSEILGGVQDKPPWTACPPPPLVNM